MDENESKEPVPIQRAMLAENAERFEDMAEEMRKFVKEGDGNLSRQHRNLLSVAYKNVIGKRRTAWRIVSAAEDKATEEYKSVCASYKETIEKELKDICDTVFSLLDDKLINKTKLEENPDKVETREEYVFYVKMKGDYYRYLCELSRGKDDKNKDKALESYKDATEVAEKLAATHPIRLGLVLNYSVFCYEIQQKPDEACKLAKEAFDGAISQLDELTEESYKDSTLIMQLLRDNLTLWTSEAAGEEEEGDS